MKYYNEENQATVLSIDTESAKITQELPWDVNIDDLIHAFYTAAIGMTFSPSTVVAGMQRFVDEHTSLLDNDYEVTE